MTKVRPIVVDLHGTSPDVATPITSVRDDRTTTTTAGNVVFSVKKQNSAVDAFILGNDGNGAALVGANNVALRIGNWIAGVFTEFLSFTTAGVVQLTGANFSPFRLKRTGSTSAVAVTYENDAGSVAVGGRATGVNTGEFIPSVNGVLDLGASGNNWATAFIRSVSFGPACAQTFTSVAGTPEGAVTSAVGSVVTDQTNGVLYLKKTGTSTAGYVVPGDIHVTATAANIAAIGNAINTTDKRLGKVIWDSTNNRAMRASGTTAASPWHVLDGSVTVTPA